MVDVGRTRGRRRWQGALLVGSKPARVRHLPRRGVGSARWATTACCLRSCAWRDFRRVCPGSPSCARGPPSEPPSPGSISPRLPGSGRRTCPAFSMIKGIVRHRGKIAAAIGNAGLALRLIEEQGSLAAYVWGYVPEVPEAAPSLRSISPESSAMSRDLKRRGWSFVGPTTVYAFMQAMGLVNDHLVGCWARDEVRGRTGHVFLSSFPEPTDQHSVLTKPSKGAP